MVVPIGGRSRRERKWGPAGHIGQNSHYFCTTVRKFSLRGAEKVWKNKGLANRAKQTDRSSHRQISFGRSGAAGATATAPEPARSAADRRFMFIYCSYLRCQGKIPGRAALDGAPGSAAAATRPPALCRPADGRNRHDGKPAARLALLLVVRSHETVREHPCFPGFPPSRRPDARSEANRGRAGRRQSPRAPAAGRPAANPCRRARSARP